MKDMHIDVNWLTMHLEMNHASTAGIQHKRESIKRDIPKVKLAFT